MNVIWKRCGKISVAKLPRIALYLDKVLFLKPLWLYRPVLNTDDLIQWVYDNGAKKIIIPEQLHATIAVVRDPCAWPDDLQTDTLNYQCGGHMEIFGFTVKALAFDAAELRVRHRDMVERYPTMDHSGHFRPHVSLFRGGKMFKNPYEGSIILGPEQAKEYSEEKGRNIEHIKVATLMSSP